MDLVAPIVAALVAVLALFALIDGIVRRRRLAAELALAWSSVPRDAETGLFDRRVCLQRVAAEVKRARRGGGTVWVGIVTISDGDPARVGRLFHDSMRMPEVAFRLTDRVLCIARPDLGPADRDDLIGRIVAAAPRERLAIGEAVWRGPGDGDAAQLLHRASDATAEVRG